MLISHDHRFVYLAPIRTGSTSISAILCDVFGATIYTDQFFGVDPYPRHDIGLPKQYEDYFVFASVRNPYDRAISAYNWINRSMVTPVQVSETLIDPPLMRTLFDTIFDNPIQENCVPVRLDAYLKLETLEEDFQKLPFVNQLQRFPHENAAPKIIDTLDDTSIDYVQKHYQKDFEYFGYDIVKLYL